MANVVGRKDLFDSIEVARVVVKLLDLPTHYGLVLFFGGHRCILLSDQLPLERQSSSHTAVAFRSSAGIVRAITCRLCTTAERLRSKRFLRTPL